jgi:hypothetical protein
MKQLTCALLLLVGLSVSAAAQTVLFDFNNAPLHAPLPLDLTVGGITAHFSATGPGFSIQQADFMGFTPAGFSGYCIAPSSVSLSDLLVGFSLTLTDFSIMFSPQELGCDDSATMRVTAYMNGVYVGTNTAVAPLPGTWPTGTLTFSSAQGFNSVVVHYDSRPPTCQDWGPIFLADNMYVTPTIESSTGGGIAPSVVTPVVSPNPFGERTTIRFALARTGPVSVTVHDVQGRLVRTLLTEAVLEPGVRSLGWDGRDDGGLEVTGGIYLCRVRAGAQETATRMIVVRAR